MESKRDHIFISYATEEWPLCEWLARRLASEGYAIWCDRLKMLGGENWPKDIEIAINSRTFRMLALLSRASMKKPNPQGEWLKGRAIGNRIGVEDFVIPLNVEGLRSDEIIWNFQTTNYINFSLSWADGLAAVLKKLHSVSAPQILQDGRRVAIESIATRTAIEDDSETLVSNCFEIVQLPRYVRVYSANAGPLSYDERRALRKEWACFDVGEYRVLAFEDPPSRIAKKHKFNWVQNVNWRNAAAVEGIDSRDLVVSLIRRCLYRLMEGAGLRYSEVSNNWFLPSDLIPHNRIEVDLPTGMKRWFYGVGKRKYWTAKGSETYGYHLSPFFDVLREDDEPSALILRTRVHLTDESGIELDKRKIVSRRKHLCKNWFNYEWCVRTLGIAQFLAGNGKHLRYGPNGEQQLIVSATPVSMDAPQKIVDENVDNPDESYTEWYSGVDLKDPID